MTCWVLARQEGASAHKWRTHVRPPVVKIRLCEPGNLATWQPGTMASLDWCYFYLACHSFQAWRTWQACHRFPPRRPSLALGQPQVFQLLCPVTMLKKTSLAFFFLKDRQAVQFSAKAPNRQLANLDMADSSSTCSPNNVRSSRHTLKA